LASQISSLPVDERERLLSELTEEEAMALMYDWSFWARENQRAPEGDWRTWLLLAGRGFGKTRCGAEWAREQVAGGRRRLALVAPTAADARDVMVEGESGILACSPPWDMPIYEPSKRRLIWKNGAMATTYSADEPDRLRGPQHDGAWTDEIAAWKYPESWDMLMFGLRLGLDPQVVATTTPKPVRLIRELLEAPTTVATRGSTFDNAPNLAPAFLDQIIAKYEGTRLGRQELAGELLDDVPGALWTRAMLEQAYKKRLPGHVEMARLVVGIDPAVTSGEDADSTGIIVAGRGTDGMFYVLADRTCRLSPDGWAKRAVEAYREFKGDRIIGEANNGGDLIEQVIRTVAPRIPYKKVTASRGKRVRAEPIAALYEQGRVFHVGGLPDLEDQMVTFVPEGSDESPDRVDALVWALSELTEKRGQTKLKVIR
jgi:predicted phage terminase large subunit-like protein